LLCEQPNGNYADTMARQFLYDHWHALALASLAGSCDERIAAIAAKAAKEVAYHVERSTDWVIRLGDGTDVSHARMQAAIDALWPFAGELFVPDAVDEAMAAQGIGPDLAALASTWRSSVEAALAEATLNVPTDDWAQRGGRQGRHTEHLGHLLTEMQFLQRAYPDARW
jgi:ring-1,2-phenylacetyl-CoA epoxidase subunit PaaC